MINIRQATVEDIPLIHEVASVVWAATYSHLMSGEQLDYMFRMMYAPDSIRAQMTEKKHTYFILFDDGKPCGYMSVHIPEATVLYLEKIYVLPSAQGRGFGVMLIDRAKEFAAQHSLNSIRLNVNRENKSRHFYEHLGFEITGQRDFHIGQGFYMNDYIMNYKL